MNIYQALANRGVKQAEIAKQTGLSTSTVSRAIDGKIQPITASFKAILDRYGLSFTYSSSKVAIIDPWESVTEEIADRIVDLTISDFDYSKSEFESEIVIKQESGQAVVNFKVAYETDSYTDSDGWYIEIYSLDLIEIEIHCENSNRDEVDIGASIEKITRIVNNWKP